MIELSYEIISGHIIVQNNNTHLLLDTGAPTSVGKDSIMLGERIYSVQSNYMGVTIEYLSEQIGSPIDGLIGADIIREFVLSINPYEEEHVVTFGEELLEFPFITRLDDFMGIPIVEIMVNGVKIRAFLDTGAQLSYIEPEITKEISPSGQQEDFYPGLGKFTSDVFELKTTIAGEQLQLTYGHLPTLLQMTLMMAGTKGIIGTELFNSYRCSISLLKKELRLERI